VKDLIFTFMLNPGAAEADALRLAHSIRTFAGKYCFNPIWMLSQRSEQELSESTRHELFSIGARFITFDLPQEQETFAFSSYVTAAGIAEGLAQGETSCLVMMASDTLVLQEPLPFLLPAGKSFGGCPVHLKLLGSGYDEPVNDFWSLVYHCCQVDVKRIFSIRTIVDEQLVRAYFNAGLLIVRPERGLFRSWQANFDKLYRLPEFEPFYQQSELYELFMHQAVLAGCLLASLKPEEFQPLPFEVNYPLHLHSKVVEDRQPSSLSQLITCRYEDYAETFGDPTVKNLLLMDEFLSEWLQAQNP
jgi:hypothetical protein